MRFGTLFLGLPVAAAVVVRRQAGNPAATAISEIQHRVEADGEADEEAYNKIDCWCKATLSTEERSSAETQRELGRLSHDIEAEGAHNQQLAIQLKRNQEELEANLNSLNTAKALREKDSARFTDDEQTHEQSIQDLSGVLQALNRGRPSGADLLQLVGSVTGKLRKMVQKPVFVQLERRLSSATSPDVVIGVVGELKSTISNQLEDMRRSEAVSKERHEGLVSAKSREIQALQKQVADEKRRLADGKVTVSRKKEQVEKGQKLLDASHELILAARSLCKNSEEAFEARRSARQAELVALAKAQADLAGTQLLALRGAATRGGPVKLCSAVLEIPEEPWRSQAKAACELAKAGNVKEASDAAEKLEDDLRQAQQEASRQQEECEAKLHDAQEEASVAEQATSAEAGVVDSEKSEAESRMRDIEAEDQAADKAKKDLAQIRAAQHKLMQDLRMSANSAGELLKKAAVGTPGSAGASLHEALSQSDRLADDAVSFDGALAKDSEHIFALLDDVRRAAGSALIPLREVRADSEEAALALERDSRERAARSHRVAVRGCDIAKISEKAQRLEGYAQQISAASEALAYDMLR